eukprot:gnl/Dysnectes_brevis/6008_a9010_247.p1 GENE.gnl/Dysnectes_brevis/6008_a9010_247~~gnl/Dysnectes_brevis/6008_a9010_247.p1  ORF type:complete len:1023 (+),score=181.35 gnl/Dysnectes_brevis/6008_a9010_247:85-3153(+)
MSELPHNKGGKHHFPRLPRRRRVSRTLPDSLRILRQIYGDDGVVSLSLINSDIINDIPNDIYICGCPILPPSPTPLTDLNYTHHLIAHLSQASRGSGPVPVWWNNRTSPGKMKQLLIDHRLTFSSKIGATTALLFADTPLKSFFCLRTVHQMSNLFNTKGAALFIGPNALKHASQAHGHLPLGLPRSSLIQITGSPVTPIAPPRPRSLSTSPQEIREQLRKRLQHCPVGLGSAMFSGGSGTSLYIHLTPTAKQPTTSTSPRSKHLPPPPSLVRHMTASAHVGAACRAASSARITELGMPCPRSVTGAQKAWSGLRSKIRSATKRARRLSMQCGHLRGSTITAGSSQRPLTLPVGLVAATLWRVLSTVCHGWMTVKEMRAMGSNLHTLLCLPGGASLPLHRLCNGLSWKRGCQWMRFPGRPSRALSLELSYVHRLAVLVMLDRVVLPAARQLFYICPAGGAAEERNARHCSSPLVYFWLHEWRVYHDTQLSNMCQPKQSVKGPPLRLRRLHAPPTHPHLPPGRMRLVPKSGGSRVVLNLSVSLRMVKVPAKDPLSPVYAARPSIHPSANSLLRPLLRVAADESRAPHRTASGLGHTRMALRRMTGRRATAGLAVDMTAAFDSVPADKLADLLLEGSTRMMRRKQYRMAGLRAWRWRISSSGGAYSRGEEMVDDMNMEVLLPTSGRVPGSSQGALIVPAGLRVETRERLERLLIRLLRGTLVSTGNAVYLQTGGIPQGSCLSTLLCGVWYSYKEREASLTPRHGLLLRYVDDWLLLGTRQEVSTFIQKVRTCPDLPISEPKLKATGDTIGAMLVRANVDSSHPGLLAWCGLLILLKPRLQTLPDVRRWNRQGRNPYLPPGPPFERALASCTRLLWTRFRLARTPSAPVGLECILFTCWHAAMEMWRRLADYARLLKLSSALLFSSATALRREVLREVRGALEAHPLVLRRVERRVGAGNGLSSVMLACRVLLLDAAVSSAHSGICYIAACRRQWILKGVDQTRVLRVSSWVCEIQAMDVKSVVR